ncbi:FAD-dependent oxidoreductase domain-containing protein 2-like [Elysia marginata]|uniref:FAD-dependent oxidoreductase domain-containing protein 2-like n=1 Tax=Elysia marginata TaxID=1093978 RepID=A0AAV4G4F4_9GAST|nr:FAD-dependent oxidoreductase domain-containing protein 2-like [Elysia marginata]
MNSGGSRQPTSSSGCEACVHHDYCVVGAGPSGLQLGYFLQMSGRNYVIFDRSSKAGSFYELYPRHRKLISINKRHTGRKNAEYNMRHDWNSLLSHDDSLRMTRYSRQMFPDAQVLLDYLDDFQRKLNISVQFNTNIQNLRTESAPAMADGHIYRMEDQRGQQYSCRTIILATGMSVPNIPTMKGIDLARGYESVSVDPEDFEGKAVLILGRGNAAFEVADSLYGSTSLIHLIGRSRVRLAWSTHYVGDLRAVNNGLLDTYQLKSLDGLAESSLEEMKLEAKGNKIHLVLDPERSDTDEDTFDNYAFREPYDVVIRALGFTFDDSIFANGTSAVSRGKALTKKYPAINHNYESVDTRGLFYAGTASHSLDFRKSAGGFIHGFRYTARTLHRLLEWRYEQVQWPALSLPRLDLFNTILRRINEASGTYQMFQVLGDVAVFSKDGQTVRYLEEFPLQLLHQLPEHSGIPTPGAVLVVVMEYGRNFSGADKDTFREDRAKGEPSEADLSNFLHPVLYFYKTLPSGMDMSKKSSKDTLPQPDYLHHFVEDFHAFWDASHSHILPLRRFLENVYEADQREFFSASCFQIAMTMGNSPESCQHRYLRGMGLVGADDATNFPLSSRL